MRLGKWNWEKSKENVMLSSPTGRRIHNLPVSRFEAWVFAFETYINTSTKDFEQVFCMPLQNESAPRELVCPYWLWLHFAEATTRMTWPNAAGAAPLALI